MSDWQPQVVRIEKVEKHPDADALDICTVLGDYPVISKRDEYRVDELVAYIPIDSIVPDTQEYYFLCPKQYEKYEDENGVVQRRQVGNKFPVGSVPEKNRIIKAKRIRGIYSQGMLAKLPEPVAHISDSRFMGTVLVHQYVAGTWVAGDSLVEALQLKKWEEEEEENTPTAKKSRAPQAAPPKGWTIPKYDIDGIRKYLSCLRPDEEIVLTEKIHGANAGFSHDGEKLWVKSRNFYKKFDEDDMWWDIAIRYDLANKLAAFPGMVFFGEVYGHVKGFRYDAPIEDGQLISKFRVFDVYNTKTQRYVDYDERVRMATEAGLDLAPELYRGPWTTKEELYPLAEGMSTLNPKHIREGWVLNTAKERYEERLNSRMQVKLVGEGYNLQK